MHDFSSHIFKKFLIEIITVFLKSHDTVHLVDPQINYNPTMT
jgi:hypothetical protein